jgi:hypothetical protein
MNSAGKTNQQIPGNSSRAQAYLARPKSWPPPTDFPVAVGKDGRVVSRYGDHVWNLSDWAKVPMVLNFGDGPQRKDRPSISAENAQLLRQIAAWFLFGPRAAREAGTLKAKFKLIRPIFTGCSARGILASGLFRYPAAIEEIGSNLSPSRFDESVSVLHGLYEQREKLGFFILNPAGIARLVACVPEHVTRQTPYIPPRIWAYIVNRCKEFLDDYALHMSSIEDCFSYCLERYMDFEGQTETTASGRFTRGRRPPSETILGSHFSDISSQFGIEEVIRKWTVHESHRPYSKENSIQKLSSYLTLAGYVGTLYIAAFSLMRVSEVWKLRSDCFKKHTDAEFGDVYLLQGDTTKTQKEVNALWVTSESTSGAISVMTSAARLRMHAASANPDAPVTKEYLMNPYLVPRSYDPWSCRRSTKTKLSTRHSHLSLAAVVKVFPLLFDRNQLEIQPEDLIAARRVSPSLDDKKFAAGKTWTLCWHQLRRTGTVNMFASGTVSEYSLQYQLKHSTLLMTHFYGQGFSELSLNEKTRREILHTMYEMAANDAIELFNDDFISPHGEARKTLALAPIERKELKELRKLAEKGGIPWRETPFGGCTKAGPCEYGGFDHMIHCGGGNDNAPCAHGLFDKRKQPAVLELSRRIRSQLIDIGEKSPMRSWLSEMVAALNNIILAMNEGPDNEQC